MINIQDFFDKLQERNLLFINEKGRVSVEMNSVIDTLFEFNELEKTKQQKKDDLVPCEEKIREPKPNRLWTKEEDAFLIEALEKGMTYRKIASNLNRTMGAISQRAWHCKKKFPSCTKIGK